MAANSWESGAARTAGTLLALGALGLAATCVFYVLAGPAAALPGGAAQVGAAVAATPAASAWMRAASLAGMPSDVLLAVACGLYAAIERSGGRPAAASGWAGLAVSGAVFVVVDAMVGSALPAAVAAGEPGYEPWRALFDGLFAFGAAAAGAGALAIAWAGRLGFRWPAARWVMGGAGGVCLTASIGHFAGWPTSPAIGPGIAMLAMGAIISAWATLDDASGRR